MLKFQKKNFSKLVYRQQFELFGHKLTLENSNARKQFAVKLYKFYYEFLDIKKNFLQTKQFNLIKFLLGFEIIFFAGKYLLKYFPSQKVDLEKENNPIQNTENNKIIYNLIDKNIQNFFDESEENNKFEIKNLFLNPNSVFYRTNILDLALNLYVISTLGKYLNIINPSALKKILLLSTISCISSVFINEKVKKYFKEKIEINNFNIFKDMAFLSKMLISYFLFGFLDKIFLSKTIGYKIFRINRKPILMFFCFFIFAKLTNFFSLISCDNIK